MIMRKSEKKPYIVLLYSYNKKYEYGYRSQEWKIYRVETADIYHTVGKLYTKYNLDFDRKDIRFGLWEEETIRKMLLCVLSEENDDIDFSVREMSAEGTPTSHRIREMDEYVKSLVGPFKTTYYAIG